MFLSCHYYLVVWLILAILAYDGRTTRAAQWKPVRCPKQCVCRAENSLRMVYCDIQNKHEDLTTVPDNFPEDSQFISLSRNKIATIPVGAFAKLTQLRYLVLSFNELQSLHRDVFRGLTNLTSLNIANNNLSFLPSGLLSSLPSLQDLYLDGNLLQNLPKDFLKGLTALRRLLLNNNQFSSFSQQAFGFRGEQLDHTKTTKSTTTLTPTTLAPLNNNFTSLVELRLNHNGIGLVQHGSFNQMSDLKRLKLNDNNISTLPRGLFRELKSLRLVSLYNNPFQCTCSLKWLKHWILHNNKKITFFHRRRIKCDGPPGVQGKPLIDVKDEEFGCLSKQWTKWSSWSPCTKPCGGGRQSRTRNCTRAYSGGTCKDSTRHWQVCNTHKCEPVWGVWSAWTPCSVTCSIGYQTRRSKAECIQLPCKQRLKSEVRACNRGICPLYGEWSGWSLCDKLCGQGAQTRNRTCNTTDAVKRPCSGPDVDTKSCKVRECAEWASWSAWSTCSKSCSQGMQTRKRDCVVVYGSKTQCPGSSTEQRSCNAGDCPVHGGWSPWSKWSKCSKTCGLGLNKRHRTCTSPPPKHGGNSCKGSTIEVTNCVRRICKDGDNSEFTQWSSWSKCSTNCGEGIRTRSRKCKKLDPVSGVSMCLGNHLDYSRCEMYQCSNNGAWGEWSHWSKCFGNCNQGLRLRFRFCVNSRGHVGPYTCGNNQSFSYERQQTCKPTSCNYNPVWSTWSNWSGCSKSCSRGTKRRKRFCLTKVIGQRCPGQYESKEPCNTHKCPVDGGWSDWSGWGECSQQCGGGMKMRNRTCTVPTPVFGGRDCIGDRSDKNICNAHKCTESVQGDQGTDPTSINLKTSTKCPKPQHPKNGRYILKKQRDDNTYMEYKCDPYYRNRGPSTIRFCMDTGKWNGETAECVPDCGEIGNNALPGKRLTKYDNIMYMNESWPWQAAIKAQNDFKCGGSLVSDQWIVTAAHCVLEQRTKKPYKSITVYLGTNNLDPSSHGLPDVQVIPVQKVIFHNGFDWKIYNSDIAILKLQRKVHITPSVHPVCLPKSRRRRQLLIEGKMGVAVGWGSRRNYLRQIPLPVVSLEECRRSFKKWPVTAKMLCAGYNDRRRDTCKRDSGGGFLFLDKHGRKVRWVLGGIVSWGYPQCGKMGKYSVFTNVAKHIHWIRKKMGEN